MIYCTVIYGSTAQIENVSFLAVNIPIYINTARISTYFNENSFTNSFDFVS